MDEYLLGAECSFTLDQLAARPDIRPRGVRGLRVAAAAVATFPSGTRDWPKPPRARAQPDPTQPNPTQELGGLAAAQAVHTAFPPERSPRMLAMVRAARCRGNGLRVDAVRPCPRTGCRWARAGRASWDWSQRATSLATATTKSPSAPFPRPANGAHSEPPGRHSPFPAQARFAAPCQPPQASVSTAAPAVCCRWGRLPGRRCHLGSARQRVRPPGVPAESALRRGRGRAAGRTAAGFPRRRAREPGAAAVPLPARCARAACRAAAAGLP